MQMLFVFKMEVNKAFVYVYHPYLFFLLFIDCIVKKVPKENLSIKVGFYFL